MLELPDGAQNSENDHFTKEQSSGKYILINITLNNSVGTRKLEQACTQNKPFK